jgi:hypothetical protein
MKGSITIVAVTVLLTLHILKGDCGCFRNLRRIFGPSDFDSPGVLRRRLELGRGRLKAVRASLKGISGWRGMQRRGGLLLKPAV